MYRFDTSERYRWMSSGRKSDIALRVGNLRRRVTCLRMAESARQVDLVASTTVSVQAEPAEDFQLVYFDPAGPRPQPSQQRRVLEHADLGR